ncbi:MAG: hypothetical protein FWG74_03520, partial [Planctomycetes bacterium]|nr:hypothetical protein [Planctomycetota bacterium]
NDKESPAIDGRKKRERRGMQPLLTEKTAEKSRTPGVPRSDAKTKNRWRRVKTAKRNRSLAKPVAHPLPNRHRQKGGGDG